MKRPWRIGLLVLTAAAVLVVPLPGSAPFGGERTIRIEATSTGFPPAVVRARVGERVTIELVAMDVVHGALVDYLWTFPFTPATRRSVGSPGIHRVGGE